MVPGGMDEQGDLWIPPTIWWPRTRRPTPDEIVEEMLRFCAKFSPIFWWAGRDHITQSLAPFIEKRSSEERIFVPFEVLSEAKDKQTKCQPIRAMFKMGRVHLPSFAEWYGDAVNEMLRFDKGTHDDFVDAIEKLGRGLASQVRAYAPVVRTETFEPPTLTLDWVRSSHERLCREEDLAGVGM
jgi:predicted phage terminase large subunit-like protein